MFKVINEKLTSIEEKFEDCKAELEKLIKKENEEVKIIFTEEGERLENLEKETRKRNIVIKGLDDTADDTVDLQMKIEELIARMGVSLNVGLDKNEIFRLGKFIEGKIRSVLVKLQSFDKKIAIYQNSKMLKVSNIWVDDDATKAVQDKRRRLISHLKVARQNS
ncbi:hypothetical protein Zmor_021739 [Zophobas morio]|uniref:Endonuclease-reverse transcriptase n=1 Tax=Zophobas morio TaxID=2755281 RepID=A0AA38I6B2_9CUCU|nr:hypothetical protein Zmor_021739 [Zophobas morio]